jgi:hypothetical protein
MFRKNRLQYGGQQTSTQDDLITVHRLHHSNYTMDPKQFPQFPHKVTMMFGSKTAHCIAELSGC